MSSNKLSHLIEISEINWKNVEINLDQTVALAHSFPLSPGDYLEFAQADLELRGTRGYVNSISNAKRAIDCQVDSFVHSLGYKPDRLRGQLGKRLTAQIEKASSVSSLPFVFKFLESLGVFTPAVVDRVRVLRHDVEHRFRRPSRKTAVEALEIATLFVRATESARMNVWSSFGIGSGPINYRGTNELERELNCNIEPEGAKPHVDVELWRKPFDVVAPKQSVQVLPEHETYYWFLQLGFALPKPKKAQPILRSLIESSKAAVNFKTIRIIG